MKSLSTICNSEPNQSTGDNLQYSFPILCTFSHFSFGLHSMQLLQDKKHYWLLSYWTDPLAHLYHQCFQLRRHISSLKMWLWTIFSYTTSHLFKGNSKIWNKQDNYFLDINYHSKNIASWNVIQNAK